MQFVQIADWWPPFDWHLPTGHDDDDNLYLIRNLFTIINIYVNIVPFIYGQSI